MTTMQIHYPDSPVRIADKPANLTWLAMAWELGYTVSLYHKGLRQWCTGTIQGIQCESGYQCGQRPRHFNVSLFTQGKLVEVYIRTV